jgi:hypothetical protein
MLPLIAINHQTDAILDDPRAPDDIYLRIATELDCNAIVALAGSNAAARAAMQQPGFWAALAGAKGFALDPTGTGSTLRRFFDACRARERDLAERRVARVAGLQTALLLRQFDDATAILAEIDDGRPIELQTDALIAGLTPSPLALRLLARLPPGYHLPESVLDRAIARLVVAGRDDNAREAAVVYEVATRLADREAVLRRWLGRRLTTEARAVLIRAFGDERLDIPGDEDYALRDAIVLGDAPAIRRLVRRGEQIIDSDVVTHALRMKNIDTIQTLLDLVDSVEVTRSVLWAAMFAGADAFKLVVDKDPNYAPPPGELLSVIGNDDPELVGVVFDRITDKAAALQLVLGKVLLMRRYDPTSPMLGALEALLVEGAGA